MRAVVIDEFGPAEAGRLDEVADPVAGPGEVLIEIFATAANDVDNLLIGGLHQVKPMLPFIPGKGPAGVVRAVGAGVGGFKQGDRVLGMCEPGGGYAELIAVPAGQCHILPDAMPFADAASMALVFDTAWFALRERGRYRDGESVLVLGGSGGVGLAAIQLAKALGATVLAGVSNQDKYDLARDAGADAIIALDWPDLKETMRLQVAAANGGEGVDIIIDPLGDDILDSAIRALAWRGRMVVIGFAAGRIPTIRANYLLVKNIEVTGLQIGDYRKRQPDLTAACFRELFALYEEGRIRPLPTTEMPITDWQDALAAISGRTARGRIVLMQDRD
ncbi:MAG: NADPH:quinone oxidoreductase family protein [Alphaproteobacteria bacterium]